MDFIEDDSTWPYSRAKTAVIRAAASVIRENGPRAATLKNIAVKAGITEPAIFRHFQGVDGLFKGLFFVFERINGRISAAFDRPEKGLAKLVEATRSSLAIFGQNKDLAYLVLHAEHIFRGYDDLRKRLVQLRKADHAVTMSAFEEAHELGEIRTDVVPRLVALTITGILIYTLQGWVESETEMDIANVALARIEELIGLFRSS